MPNWKEFHFKIEGKIGEEEITPLTMPMARLAEYMADLATVMGHKESVHFIKTDEGSALSVVYVDAEEEARVIHQIQNSARGAGPHQANAAYKRLDARLREDNAVGNITNISKNTQVIEFPGRRTERSEPYGPIGERASVVGVLKRLGGFDDSIPVHLQRADGVVFCCEASPTLARELKDFYEKTIRVHGFATYYREDGNWRLERFRIQSYDPEPLRDEKFSETIEKLRAIPGNEWNEITDPFEELRRLRYGEDAQA